MKFCSVVSGYLMGNADLAEQIPFCQNLPECQAMLDGDEIIPEARCVGGMLEWLRKPYK